MRGNASNTAGKEDDNDTSYHQRRTTHGTSWGKLPRKAPPLLCIIQRRQRRLGPTFVLRHRLGSSLNIGSTATLSLGNHRILDAAVADAYGWPADLSDEDILTRLLALNQEQAAVQRGL
jgi:hypothetical protein